MCIRDRVTYNAVLRDFVFDDVRNFENSANDKFTMFEVNGKYGVMKSHNCEIIIPAL